MIQLTIGTRLYLYEDDQMEQVMERAKAALMAGDAVQIIPGGAVHG